MPNEDIHPGDLVEHLKHPEWGQGDVVSVDRYRAILSFHGGTPFGPFDMKLLRKVKEKNNA